MTDDNDQTDIRTTRRGAMAGAALPFLGIDLFGEGQQWVLPNGEEVADDDLARIELAGALDGEQTAGDVLQLSASAGGSGIFEDSDGDGVYEQTTGDGIDTAAVSTDELSIGSDGPATSFDDLGGGATDVDYTISSASDLETLDSTLSPGDTVLVERPDTPYRTSSWIDIDTSHVEVIFEDRFAADGQPIVKVADGANVGGIRIGVNAHTEHVRVENYGHHGNSGTSGAYNQDQTVKRLHGIIVDDAKHVDLVGCYQTRTSPYREHNTGGSGISVRVAARDVVIRRNVTDDVGDRGVQMGGVNCRAIGCHNIQSYDRAVSLDVVGPNDTEQSRSHALASTVAYCSSEACTNGSVIGANNGTNHTRPGGQNTIMGNLCYGEYGTAITLRGSGGGCSVVGNTIVRTSNTNYGDIELVSTENTVIGNTFTDEDSTQRANAMVTIDSQRNVVVGNMGRYIGIDAIQCRASRCLIGFNRIAECSGDAIHVNGKEFNIITNNWASNTDGFHINSSKSVVANNVQENCQTYGYDLAGDNIQCIGNYIDQSGFDAGQTGYRADGSNVVLAYNQAGEGEARDIEVGANGVDVQIWGHYDVRNIADSGTRTRWDGWIGGGPLGGVDLSTVTGQWEGDLAVADGTSTASAGAWARWDASASNWQYVDPTGTV